MQASPAGHSLLDEHSGAPPDVGLVVAVAVVVELVPVSGPVPVVAASVSVFPGPQWTSARSRAGRSACIICHRTRSGVGEAMHERTVAFGGR